MIPPSQVYLAFQKLLVNALLQVHKTCHRQDRNCVEIRRFSSPLVKLEISLANVV